MTAVTSPLASGAPAGASAPAAAGASAAGRGPGPGRGSDLGRFLLRRLLTLLASLLVTSVLVFSLLSVLPGSPAQVVLGTDATPGAVAALTRHLGLDVPLWRQYARWAGGLVTFDLGTSYVSGQPIGPEIAQSLQVTGPLVGLGLLVGALLGGALGTASALRHTRLSGALLSSLGQLGVAVPNFVAGLLLVVLVGVKLGWLPTGGFTFWSADPLASLRELALPSLALALAEGAVLSRYVRSAVVEVLRSDYLRTARAKGLRTGQALLRHGLRNGALPLVTVAGLELAGLLVGAVVVETVFALPGLGTLLLNAVQNRDLNLVEDVVMLLAAVVLVVNVLVDVSYRLLDPRLRQARP